MKAKLKNAVVILMCFLVVVVDFRMFFMSLLADLVFVVVLLAVLFWKDVDKIFKA